MELPRQGIRLRIVVGENRRYQGRALYEWLVVKARECGMAGATVCRGIMGYGANSRIHTTSIMRLSEDLPMVVEIVDSERMIKEFLDIIDPVIGEGLVTLEEVRIGLYRAGGERKMP